MSRMNAHAELNDPIAASSSLFDTVPRQSTRPQSLRPEAPAVRLAWRAVVLGLACGVFSLPPVAAQELDTAELTRLKALDLEQLLEVKVVRVYSASKFEQDITDAPSSVTVITSDEIKRYGYRSLGEILASAPGFFVSYDRSYAFLGTRGVSLGDFNSRMLLLVDGHRINNNLNDGGAIGTDFILDVDLIDRVEVIRGPGSLLYGNNAFFGVINVVTRNGQQLDGAEVSAEYASFDTYKGRVSVGKSFANGLEFLLSGSYYDSAGPERLYYEEYDTPEQNNGIARNLDADTYGSFFGSVGYRGLKLQGGIISREKVNPTAQHFTTFNDPRLRTVNDRSFVDLTLAHEFPEIVDLTARLYYDRGDYSVGYPFGAEPATTMFEEVQTGEWWGAELQLNKRLWEKHTVSVGAEYRDDFRQAKRLFDENTTYTDVEANRRSHGVFVQGHFVVRNNLHFTGGMRYDQYGDFDPALNPRLAAVYRPLPESTVKAIYSTAYRAPNFLELSDPRFQGLNPEEITSYELVYEQGIGRYLRSSVAGYYNLMDDLIVFESGGFGNENAESLGTELALEGNWAGGVRGRVSYAIQRTEIHRGSSSIELTDSPEHLFKFNLSVPLVKEKLFVGAEYQYTSSRHTLFTSREGVTVPGVDTQGFGVLNLTLFSQNLVKNLEASASVYNLLDESYADPSSRFHLQDQLPRDGRSFRIKMTYRF